MQFQWSVQTFMRRSRLSLWSSRSSLKWSNTPRMASLEWRVDGDAIVVG